MKIGSCYEKPLKLIPAETNLNKKKDDFISGIDEISLIYVDGMIKSGACLHADPCCVFNEKSSVVI